MCLAFFCEKHKKWEIRFNNTSNLQGVGFEVWKLKDKEEPKGFYKFLDYIHHKKPFYKKGYKTLKGPYLYMDGNLFKEILFFYDFCPSCGMSYELPPYEEMFYYWVYALNSIKPRSCEEIDDLGIETIWKLEIDTRELWLKARKIKEILNIFTPLTFRNVRLRERDLKFMENIRKCADIIDEYYETNFSAQLVKKCTNRKEEFTLETISKYLEKRVIDYLLPKIFGR